MALINISNNIITNAVGSTTTGWGNNICIAAYDIEQIKIDGNNIKNANKHAIYAGNLSGSTGATDNVTITNNTISGWSKELSGNYAGINLASSSSIYRNCFVAFNKELRVGGEGRTFYLNNNVEQLNNDFTGVTRATDKFPFVTAKSVVLSQDAWVDVIDLTIANGFGPRVYRIDWFVGHATDGIGAFGSILVSPGKQVRAASGVVTGMALVSLGHFGISGGVDGATTDGGQVYDASGNNITATGGANSRQTRSIVFKPASATKLQCKQSGVDGTNGNRTLNFTIYQFHPCGRW